MVNQLLWFSNIARRNQLLVVVLQRDELLIVKREVTIFDVPLLASSAALRALGASFFLRNSNA